MNKSIVVEVERRVQEPRYQRTIRRTSRFMAHDEANHGEVGDRVRIEETRPLSKRKRWILREILEGGKVDVNESSELGTREAWGLGAL